MPKITIDLSNEVMDQIAHRVAKILKGDPNAPTEEMIQKWEDYLDERDAAARETATKAESCVNRLLAKQKQKQRQKP